MPLKNKEKLRAYKKAWAEAHREELRIYHREYYLAHREENAAASKKWHLENPEKAYTASRNWYLRNVEKQHARTAMWERNNPHAVAAKNARRRSRKKNNGGSYTAAEWAILKNSYGGCAGCGLSEPEIMAIGRKLVPDHVVALAKDGTNDIGNLQPLCHGKGGCNNKKSAKYIDYRRAS